MTIALDRITTTAARMEGGVKRYGFGDASIRALDGVDVGDRFDVIADAWATATDSWPAIASTTSSVSAG